MKRRQWVEFEDLPWFPAGWRELIVDFLRFFNLTFKPYAPAAPLLARELARQDCRRILDLGSGGSGPMLLIQRELGKAAADPAAIVLTDLFPYPRAWDRVRAASAGAVTFVAEPVDARAVPPALTGFRTMFSSFHHLAPAEAREVIADAVARHEGIGIFEFTRRDWWHLALMLGSPLLVWLTTPWIRPRSGWRLFWTYLVPVVPLLVMVDGIVSNLRTYTQEELAAMTAGHQDYLWDFGELRGPAGFPLTYLLGGPRDARSPCAAAGAPGPDRPGASG